MKETTLGPVGRGLVAPFHTSPPASKNNLRFQSWNFALLEGGRNRPPSKNQ